MYLSIYVSIYIYLFCLLAPNIKYLLCLMIIAIRIYLNVYLSYHVSIYLWLPFLLIIPEHGMLIVPKDGKNHDSDDPMLPNKPPEIKLSRPLKIINLM